MMLWTALMGFLTTVYLASGHVLASLRPWQILVALTFVALWASFVPSLVGQAWEESRWNKWAKDKERTQRLLDELREWKALYAEEHRARVAAEARVEVLEESVRTHHENDRYMSMLSKRALVHKEG